MLYHYPYIPTSACYHAIQESDQDTKVLYDLNLIYLNNYPQ